MWITLLAAALVTASGLAALATLCIFRKSPRVRPRPPSIPTYNTFRRVGRLKCAGSLFHVPSIFESLFIRSIPLKKVLLFPIDRFGLTPTYFHVRDDVACDFARKRGLRP